MLRVLAPLEMENIVVKHKYLAVIPKSLVRRDSGDKVEIIAERNKVEFLGSRLDNDGNLQVGYSLEPSKVFDVELYLKCIGIEAKLKDYGDDDGRRGRVTHADTSAYPDTDTKPQKAKRTAKPKPVKEKLTVKDVPPIVKERPKPQPPPPPPEPDKGEGDEDEESDDVSQDAIIPPLGEAFQKWSKLGSPEHEQAVKLLGAGCEDPVSKQWGLFSVHRSHLVGIIKRKFQTVMAKWGTEKRSAFLTLEYNSTITALEPFIREAFGKDADFVIWHTCHNK